MKFLTSLVLFCIFLPILFLIVFTPEPCYHEETRTLFSFVSEDSFAYSYTRPICKECGKKLRYTNFKGTPIDQSYLETITKHTDADEIVPGEYYTVSCPVTQVFSNYGETRVWVNCKTENEDFIVSFTVEFREEFREQVASIEDGEEITFRGRFYDEGCGFTDAELIIK